MGRWMLKQLCYSTQWSITHERERNLAICDNVDGLRGYFAKWNRSYRETQYRMISLMWDLKKINEQTKQKQTHRFRELVIARLEWWWGNGWKHERIKRYKLPVINTHGGEKYSIGNIIENIVITVQCLNGTRLIDHFVGHISIWSLFYTRN